MIKAFIVLSTLVAIALLAGYLHLRKNSNILCKSISVVCIAAFVANIYNACALMASTEWAAMISHGLYLAVMDWFLLSILVFTQEFTQQLKSPKGAIRFLRLLVLIDTASMVVNLWARHVFIVEERQLVGKTELTSFFMIPKTYYYGVHMLISYILVAVVAYMLIQKMQHTTPMYRFKYAAVSGSFIILLAVNIVYHFFDKIIPIDLSPLFFVALVVCITYFSLYYIPRKLETGLLSASIDDLKNGIICYDRDGKCVYVNEEAKHFFGTEHKAQLEAYYLVWSADLDVEDDDIPDWMEEKELDGEKKTYQIRFHKLFDERGSFIGSCFTFSDNTEESKSYAREHYRATHDQLTGLYNREGFFEYVRLTLDNDKENKWLIVCLDIKDFKLINDLFGVDRGDEILKRVAEVMLEESTGRSLFARISGDRFAMLIPKDAFKESVFETRAKEICSMAENDVYRMHLHVGVYPVENKKLEVSIMCDRAFLAIQRIKTDYQQVISYYDSGLGNQQIKEKKMLAEFENALQAGQFKVYLQPQISVDQKLLGAEALVRWTHPTRGMISPGEFIPIFENAGLIYKLDRYVWEYCCARLKKWKQAGREDLHISVNISQKDLYFMDIYQVFTGLVEQYDINPKNLKLEITETALMSEIKQQLGLLEKLRKYGFQIEIDDFGSGYSSLNTLKDIEVDVLKMDMGFLSETQHKDRSKTIMNMVFAMSKQLGIAVITEGVETYEQVQYLTEAGCDMFQGYYFAKPMAIENFEDRYMADYMA